MGNEDDNQSFRYMNRTYSTSTSASDSSATFSECNSDRSGEFAPDLRLTHRLVLEPIYTDETIQSLIAELGSDSAESQLRAAMELRLLAKHSPENRVRIAIAGAVRPLVALISSPDRQVQEQGVTAILNLSLCDENKSPIAAAGAIRALVLALKTGTSISKENAACTLLRLSQSEELRGAIGPSGAIPPLVKLLETGTSRGKKDAATALYALCSTVKENKIRAIQAGIVRPLLDLMAEPESGMVDKAAYVLATVAAEAKAEIVEEGGIPVLVEIVEIGKPKQKEIAADVILQLCHENVGVQAKVHAEGAIPPLVDLAESGTPRARKKAETLVNLLRKLRTGRIR